MKRCVNPNCESTFLYGSSKTTCPFCHGRLVEHTAAQAPPAREILPPDRVVLRDLGGAPEPQAELFASARHGAVECRGRIVEIDHQELFHSRRHKLLNALLRGEPYQFAHQTIEYTIRVENITDGVPTEVMDFCLFGSCLGRLQIGDTVRIRARSKRGRNIVRSIFNETTGCAIGFGLQIPAGAIRFLLLLAAALICAVIWFLCSGAITSVLAALATALFPLILIFFIIQPLFSSLFPGRRRRR
jgi:hypothetical protein